MTEDKKALHLFEGYGIELEYMIVNKDTLDIMPVTDEILKAIAGEYVNEVKVEDMEWSNELTLHVVELKTGRPAASLKGLGEKFYQHTSRINEMLKEHNAMLMPTSMHPWMDPHKEMKLWPHDNSPIYDAYNRIFDCRGHGWANLQSMHINLPFAGNDEFGRLHAAIRLVLPLLPMLAASSPVADSEMSGYADYRLEVYRHNQSRIPNIIGNIIPEAVFTAEDYEDKVLKPMYEQISPYDAEGILQEEWLNSRGAIARFDRNAIEIRLLDIQECPKADLAIAAFIIGLVKNLSEEKWCSYTEQQTFRESEMLLLLMEGIQKGENTDIRDRNYLKIFGIEGDSILAKDLFAKLLEQMPEINESTEYKEVLNTIISEGTLSTRILKALDYKTDKESLKQVYRKLAQCLAENKIFHV